MTRVARARERLFGQWAKFVCVCVKLRTTFNDDKAAFHHHHSLSLFRIITVYCKLFSTSSFLLFALKRCLLKLFCATLRSRTRDPISGSMRKGEATTSAPSKATTDRKSTQMRVHVEVRRKDHHHDDEERQARKGCSQHLES